MPNRTFVGIVGCGYVADLYMATLHDHPGLEVTGAYDRSERRAKAFSEYHSVTSFPSLDALLQEPGISIIANLTNPASHYDVTLRALRAGKHLYSEKPLALSLRQATDLIRLAERDGLLLASAPCSLLGEAAQTVWRELRSGAIGAPRLVYAELDDGAVHQMPYGGWITPSGAPWPFLDEFRTGAVLEHAAYYITWLTAFFGPVREVTSFTGLLVPDKVEDLAPADLAPDFACACLRMETGTVVRLTCSTLAPANHSLRIVGDEGVLSAVDCWDYETRVFLRRRGYVPGRSGNRHLADAEERPLARSGIPARRPAGYRHKIMDFSRGIAELAEAARCRRQPRLGARHALHVLEATLAITGSRERPRRVIRSDFDPIEPMPWAVGND